MMMMMMMMTTIVATATAPSGCHSTEDDEGCDKATTDYRYHFVSATEDSSECLSTLL